MNGVMMFLFIVNIGSIAGVAVIGSLGLVGGFRVPPRVYRVLLGVAGAAGAIFLFIFLVTSALTLM